MKRVGALTPTCSGSGPSSHRGRGLAQAAVVIGQDYPGVLVRDGWQSYRQFTAALHQTCLAHLLRRCRVLLLDYPGQPFVVAGKAILQAALRTRAHYRAGRLSAHGLTIARGQYLERLGRLLERTPSRRLRRAPLSSAPHRRIRRDLPQSQQILASVLRTADQRGLDTTALLVALLTARRPGVPVSLRTEPAIH